MPIICHYLLICAHNYLERGHLLIKNIKVQNLSASMWNPFYWSKTEGSTWWSEAKSLFGLIYTPCIFGLFCVIVLYNLISNMAWSVLMEELQADLYKESVFYLLCFHACMTFAHVFLQFNTGTLCRCNGYITSIKLFVMIGKFILKLLSEKFLMCLF